MLKTLLLSACIGALVGLAYAGEVSQDPRRQLTRALSRPGQVFYAEVFTAARVPPSKIWIDAEQGRGRIENYYLGMLDGVTVIEDGKSLGLGQLARAFALAKQSDHKEFYISIGPSPQAHEPWGSRPPRDQMPLEVQDNPSLLLLPAMEYLFADDTWEPIADPKASQREWTVWQTDWQNDHVLEGLPPGVPKPPLKRVHGTIYLDQDFLPKQVTIEELIEGSQSRSSRYTFECKFLPRASLPPEHLSHASLIRLHSEALTPYLNEARHQAFPAFWLGPVLWPSDLEEPRSPVTGRTQPELALRYMSALREGVFLTYESLLGGKSDVLVRTVPEDRWEEFSRQRADMAWWTHSDVTREPVAVAGRPAELAVRSYYGRTEAVVWIPRSVVLIETSPAPAAGRDINPWNTEVALRALVKHLDAITK